MRHRVRAAGVLVDENDRVLLALDDVRPSGVELWVPPGGGMEPNDDSVLDCVRREFREETGLDVEVGTLLYVREFREPGLDVQHVELYFVVHTHRGELTHTDRHTAPLGATSGRHCRWFTREEMTTSCVRPAELQDRFWRDRLTSSPSVYLGVSGPFD